MDRIARREPRLKPALQIGHRRKTEGNGERTGFEAVFAVGANDEDLAVEPQLRHAGAKRAAGKAERMRNVAAGEIERRPHIDDLDGTVLHLCTRLVDRDAAERSLACGGRHAPNPGSGPRQAFPLRVPLSPRGARREGQGA